MCKASCIHANDESTISRGYKEVSLTKHGRFCFADRGLFSSYIKQKMNGSHSWDVTNILT